MKILLIAIWLLLGCEANEVAPKTRALPHYNSADFTPRWNVADSDDFHGIPAFALTDQKGQSFTQADLDGKIVVANFFLTTCTAICSPMMHSLHKVQEHFQQNTKVLIVSHSVTPEIDTVEVLTRYATERDIRWVQWRLLTGSQSEIYDLGRSAYFIEEDLGVKKSKDDFLHTENVVLLDPKRRIRGIYNALDPSSMKALIADMEVLTQLESSRTREKL